MHPSATNAPAAFKKQFGDWRMWLTVSDCSYTEYFSRQLLTFNKVQDEINWCKTHLKNRNETDSSDIISPSSWGSPLTSPLGVGGTRASGLDFVFNTLCGRAKAVVGIEAVFSKTLLVGMTSALLSGVDFVALTRSTSCSFVAWVDKRRLAVEDAGSAVALTVERRALLCFTGLVMLLGVGPVEPLMLRFKEEFSLPERSHNTGQ